VNGDVHGGHASCGSGVRASRFLIGLVTCFATHDGISAVARAVWPDKHAIVYRGGRILTAVLLWLTDLGDTS